MDEKHDEKTEDELSKQEDGNPSSKKLFFIAIGVLVLSTIGVVFLYSSRKTKTASRPSIPYTVEPANITTAAGVEQSLTATYPVPGGWENLSEVSLYIVGGGLEQLVRYNPATNSLSLDKMAGSCRPGQPTTLASRLLSLNCSNSKASGPGDMPTVTFSITLRPSVSGVEYILAVSATDKTKVTTGALAGNWTVK